MMTPGTKFMDNVLAYITGIRVQNYLCSKNR